MILLLDNQDSFTFMLADYLQQLNVNVSVVSLSLLCASIETYNPQALIISPGPGNPLDNIPLLTCIEYFKNRIPILGICLGHQALGHSFGATIKKAIKPMHGKVCEIWCDNESFLFNGLPEFFKVTRYHSLVLTQMPKELLISAKTMEGEPMAFEHKTLPITGIQFHPEACQTEYGIQILRNWALKYKFIN